MKTIEKLAAKIEATAAEFGENAATGELVTVWNRLKAKGRTETKVGQWIDAQLERREGWSMDRGGFLYMA
jgi:hypothetical protein